MDVTDYLPTYRMSAHDLCRKILREVLHTTGITATAGIGTNLSLQDRNGQLKPSTSRRDRDGVHCRA